MFLPMLLAFACPELHLGAVRLFGHGQLVDLQVDLALVDELRFGGVLAADLALDSCLRCGGLQVTLAKMFNLNHF